MQCQLRVKKFFVGARQRLVGSGKIWIKKLQFIITTGKILNVTSDEDEERIFDPESNVTSVEDEGSDLPMDSVNFMGTVRDNYDVARKEHFDDQPYKSYFSDEDVICNVSKVDTLDSI